MRKLKTDILSQLLYWVAMGGLAIATIALAALPWLMDFIFEGSSFYLLVEHYKILILLYITGVPAWIILWMTRKLAKNIIERAPFSDSSSQSLKVISVCALFIFLCYLCTCILVQATFGIIVITVGAFMVALIAAILYRLVELAIEIKEENELTI